MRAWLRGKRRFPHLLVACFPKSGSTYLSKALQGLSGYPEYYLAEEGGHNEQDVSHRALRRARCAAVVQQHVKATSGNLALLKEFGVRPIVHVRNLLDVVVSLRDHFHREDSRAPTGFVHQEFWRLGQQEQFDYLIHMHLPWYFNFLVSWHEAEREIPLVRSSYEELFADRAGTLRRLAAFHGLPVNDTAIARALDYAALQHTRLNQGVSGRGQQSLSPRQRDAICRLGKLWHVDPKILRSVGVDELDGAGTEPAADEQIGLQLRRAA